jgi:hypothetical protein
MPAPKKLTLSDAELLQALAEGKTRRQIATENGVNAECVRWRLRQLAKHLPAPAARRADDTVALTLSAMEAMRENIRLLYEMRDACTRELQGKDGRLSVADRDADLLQSRAADPRQLLLSTMTQIRMHVELGVRLVERIHDAQELALFQQEVLAAIETADPNTAARIRGALADRRELRLALEPPQKD